VAYVSDAGTPGISDPGFLLIRQALENRIPVIPVPECRRDSGFECFGHTDGVFRFYGISACEGGKRRDLLVSLKDEQKTLIFFEAPHRLELPWKTSTRFSVTGRSPSPAS
jgi:16S rRNA (cytidine1402-2'-O)-methyltransferase